MNRGMSYRRRTVPWILCVLTFFGCTGVDPEVELAAATTSLEAGNYSEAAIRLNNVIQVQPDNAEARRLRGELSLVLGDYAEAAQDFDRARALGASSDSTMIGLADATAVLGRPDEALAMLDSAAARADDPLYWTVRAEVLLRAGRLDEAQQALESLARAGDGGARAQIVRAQVAFALDDPARAFELLGRALAAAPDDPHLLAARGELLARTNRFAEAAADLQRAADSYRAASLAPREVATLLTLVQVNLARNDLDAAEATATRLAEQAPAAVPTAYFQGLVEYRRGNFNEAAALIQPLVNAVPDAIQFRSLLGAIHLALGNFGQAEQQFQSVLAISPRDPAAVQLLAETHLRQQRPEAALATLRAVDDAVGENARVGLLRGLASLMSGDTEQGLLYLEQAASLDPTNELLKLQLARAYLAAGRDSDASDLLRESFVGSASTALEAELLRLFADVRLGTPDSSAATELLEEFPQEPRALIAVAMYSQLRGDTRRARELFEQAAELETGDASARLFIAAALVQEGRREEAEQLLAKVVAEQPSNAQALTALAELLAARGAFEEAAQLLNRVVEDSGSLSSRLALAQLRLRQGDFAAAKVQLDAAVESAPDNPEVIAVSGLLALAEGRPGDAVPLLERALSELPNRLGVSLALARAHLAAGHADAARATLGGVLAVAPRSLPARLVLGEAELDLGNIDEALSIAAALKADYPAQSGGYVLEAAAQTAARRYAAAADTLATAFERDPTWPVAIRLVETLQLAGRLAEALRASQAWAAQNPQHVPGMLLLAGLLQEGRRQDEALRAYEAILRLDGNNLAALNNSAWLTHELSRPGALALAERAYALAADNAAVLDTLGWILLGENREADAIVHLERAARLAPQVPQIRYHFAKALVALGRSDEARSVLMPLLAGDLDFEGRIDAQRLLDSL